MGRIKTHNVKRMLSILLTLCMMLTLIPALPVHAETNPGTTSVIINGQTLNATNGYLVDGEAKMNAVLGAAGCTAYFDGNGTLTLYGYTGSRIRVSESNRDLTIILMGNKNTITENGSGEKIGISLHSGNLHINAVNAARLTMNLFSNDNNAKGIEAKDISISGYADITMNVETTSTNASQGYYGVGIKALGTVSINDAAFFTAICKKKSGGDGLNGGPGIHAPGGVSINTTGDINIDASQGGTYNYAIDSLSSNSLTNVGTMTLKWKGSINSYGFHVGGPIYHPNSFDGTVENFAINIDRENCLATYRKGTPYTVNITNGSTNNLSKAQYLAGDIVTIKANDYLLDSKFKEWQGTEGLTFKDATSKNNPVAKFVMPNNNLELVAFYEYNIFNVMPAAATDYIEKNISFNWKLTDPDGKVPGGVVDHAILQLKNGATWSDTVLPVEYKSIGNHSYSVKHNTVGSRTYRLLYRVGSQDYYSNEFVITHKAFPVLTVIHGSPANASYKPGTSVTITADAPPPGKSTFFKWDSGDIIIPSESSTQSPYTFTMPSKDVVVTANYVSTPAADTALRDIEIYVTDNPTFNYSSIDLDFDPHKKDYTIDNGFMRFYKMKIIMPKKEGVDGQTVTATIEGNNCPVSSDDTSFFIGEYHFTKGVSVVKIKVTSKDGVYTDTYKVTLSRGSATPRSLAVIRGTPSSATVVEGDDIMIIADEPLEGKAFDGWVSEDITILPEDAKKPSYTFSMPNKNVTVRAMYKNIRSLSVINGTPFSANPVEGDEVTIKADQPKGLVFDKWVSQDITIPLDDASNLSYTFTMPDKDVEIQAKYENNPQLSVINGSPNFLFPTPLLLENPWLPISANTPPEGQMFDRWVWLQGYNQEITTGVRGGGTSGRPPASMPDRDATIKATYKSEYEKNTNLDGFIVSLYKDVYGSPSHSRTIPVNPVFDPDRKEYTIELTEEYKGIETITAKEWRGKQTMTAKIDGLPCNLNSGYYNKWGDSYYYFATAQGYQFTGPNTVFEITVTSEDGTKTATYKITIKRTPNPVAPIIDAANLPNGLVGVPYSYVLSANGTYPITWEISGNMPDGLTLEGNKISGTPTTLSSKVFYVKATNAAGYTYKLLSPEINEQLTGTVLISGKEKIGETLFATVSSTNNTGNLTYEWYERWADGLYKIGDGPTLFLDGDVAGCGKINTCKVTSNIQIGSISSSTFRPALAWDGGPPKDLYGEPPSSVGGVNGKIVGTTYLMEYADNPDFINGRDCQNGETTGLEANTYYVRRKAEESYHASEYTMVIVPEYSPTPEELANDAIAAANALLPTEVLVVDEAKDTNILEKFNAIPGMSETGVILTLGNVVAGGENPNIDQNGNITYSPGASYGDVKVMINRMHGAQQYRIITVSVPPHNPGVVEGVNSDITAALGYLSNMPTLVEGTHTNLIYVLDYIPGMPSTGVTLTLDATGHPNIADDGTITYGDTTKTAVVIVRVSKGPGETKEYNLYVTVPAHIRTKADVANDAIETARALLLDYQSQLNLVEGRDTNLLTVLNAIPGMSETGVILTVGGSSNPNIAKDGTITYGDGEASGNVGVKMNKAHGTEQEEIIMTIVRKDILLYGDVNGDGQINVADAAAITRYFVKGTPLIIPSAADVTKDGQINVADAAAITRYFVKGTPLPVNLP